MSKEAIYGTSKQLMSRTGQARFATLTALAMLLRLQSSEAVGSFSYVGCYNDKPSRAMSRQMQPEHPLTLDKCAALCIQDNYMFVGLEFQQECFCGNTFGTHGKAEVGACNLFLSAQPEVEAGGTWALSIYDVREVETNSITSSSTSIFYSIRTPTTSSSIPSDVGGDTPVDDLSPVESGNRAFTVVNKCSQRIRVGSTGGRITFLNSDGASEEACTAWGPSAVYNKGPMGIGCYWNLPEEENGNTKRELGPGEHARFNLHPTEGDTRWSGTIWGSTGCDDVPGCATGVCYTPYSDFVCPAYVGPGGPTTKAEFTLSDGGKDYYDVSLIDGVNLPMMIEPDNPKYPETITTNHAKYTCGSPGATKSPTDLGGCTWSFSDHVKGIEDNLSQFLRLVLPPDYEKPIPCEQDADCGGDTCGVHPQRWADGSYKAGVEQGSCGTHIAWVSAGGACAGGWSSGQFPDEFPFYCGSPVTGGQRANMYGCNVGMLAHSGYTLGATDEVCGCPDWEKEELNAPPISNCQGINQEWVRHAQPWAQYLKLGCPTAYTFPYDDQTSTFDCVDGDEAAPGFVNTQSYTITFCPGDTEAAMFP